MRCQGNGNIRLLNHEKVSRTMADFSGFNVIADVIEDVFKGASRYANAYKKDGRERIKPWVDSHKKLQYNIPIFRTVGGEKPIFVIDIDVRFGKNKRLNTMACNALGDEASIRREKLKHAVWFVKKWFKDEPFLSDKFHVKVGYSGVHLVQALPDNFNVSLCEDVIYELFPPCPKISEAKHREAKCGVNCKGWHHDPSGSNWSRYFKLDDKVVKINIDLTMYSNDHLIAGDYSVRLRGRKQTFSVPVVKLDIDDIIYRSSVKGFLRHGVSKVRYPPFIFKSLIKDRTREERNAQVVRRLGVRRVSIPTLTHELSSSERVLYESVAKSLMSDDSAVNPPCIKAHYLNACNKVRDNGHWSRMVIARYLKMKFKLDYKQIGKYIRHYINDKEDNERENTGKMLLYLAHTFKNEVNAPPGCNKMRSLTDMKFGGLFPTEACVACNRRSSPLETKRGDKKSLVNKRIYKAANRTAYRGIERVITEQIEDQKNGFILLEKTTRCGATTTITMMCHELDKKLLVVVPTVAIAEKTVHKAVQMAMKRAVKRDPLTDPISVGIFASNVKACSKLVAKIEAANERKQMEPDWGSEKLACKGLRFVSKPMCKKCNLRNDIFAVPLHVGGKVVPINLATVETCAYRTITTQIEKFDVLIVTYAKLSALLHSGSEDNEGIISRMIEHFDVMFLDEISQIVRPPIYQFNLSTTPNITTKIMDEFNTLSDKYPNAGVLSPLILAIESFITVIDMELKDSEIDGNYFNFTANPIPVSVREEMIDEGFKVHSMIENMAFEDNVLLKSLESFIDFINYDNWYIQRTSSASGEYTTELIIPIDIRAVKIFVSRCHAKGKKILLTDATTPYVKLSEFFMLDTKTVMLGDPRKTNNSQLVVCDQRHLTVNNYLKSQRCPDGCNEKYLSPGGKCVVNARVEYGEDKRCHVIRETFIKFVESVATKERKSNGNKGVLVVVPNKQIYNGLMYQKSRMKRMPKNVQITYFRSDETIGVECSKRIMVTYGVPFAPPGSYYWLAKEYQNEGLYEFVPLDELAYELRRADAQSAYYQAIGRVKDPKGGMYAEPSIVYSYGFPSRGGAGKGLIDLFLTNGGKMDGPAVFKTPERVNRFRTWSHVAYVWNNKKTMFHPGMYILYDKMLEQRDPHKPITMSTAWRMVRGFAVMANKTQKGFTDEVFTIGEDMLRIMGFERVKGNNGSFALRVREDAIE